MGWNRNNSRARRSSRCFLTTGRGTSENWKTSSSRAISICDSDIVYAEHLCIGSEQTPVTMKEILAQEEKRVMEMTLMKYNGDKQKAMKELDVSKSVFYDKLKRYQIK